MTIRKLFLCVGVLCLPLPWVAGDETPAPLPKADYTALSKMIHKVVVSQLPKVFHGQTGWGQTVPIPDGLRLMQRRKKVQVGDHLELPHGHWRKTRGWFEDPDRDLTILVRDLHPLGTKAYRITLDVDAMLHGATEIEQWQKGLLLVAVTGEADARVGILLECDVALSLGNGFPPEVKVEPKVTDLKLELKDFDLRRVDASRPGIALALQGPGARDLGNEVRKALQDLLHTAEPGIKDRANEAIARSLREGKGTFSAAALLQALSTQTNAKAGK